MTNQIIASEQHYGAHHYKPLPVVLTRGEGVHVWDDEGNQYLDMMSAYSAVSHGHCHPRLVTALSEQAAKLAVVSRAYYSDKLAPFLEKICTMMGYDMALPMNTGAEAVETALKAARKWAYTVKGVPADQAEIIVCTNNFHGRTIAIISMSSEAQYRDGFGPLTPGFKQIPYGDLDALKAAITPNTAAFMLEPIQGEGGILVPPNGFLKQAAKLCRENKVLLIADEIQVGLGRTGKLKACDHEQVIPDGLILGKALGGGLLPVSMFLANREVMAVFKPGDHGSTFGGNPLSSVVALEALKILEEEQLAQRAAELGEYFIEALENIQHPAIKIVRGRGLLIGVEIDPAIISAREVCLRLMARGILSKETHHTVVRFAPPLIITREQLSDAIAIIREVFSEIT